MSSVCGGDRIPSPASVAAGDCRSRCYLSGRRKREIIQCEVGADVSANCLMPSGGVLLVTDHLHALATRKCGK